MAEQGMKQQVDTSEALKVIPTQSRIRWAITLTGMRMPGSGTGSGRRLGLADLAMIAIKDKTSVFTTPAIITEDGVACKPSKEEGFTFMKWEAVPWIATPILDEDKIMYFVGTQMMILNLAAPDTHENDPTLQERRALFLLVIAPGSIKRHKDTFASMNDRERKKNKGQLAAVIEKLEQKFMKAAAARGFTVTSTTKHPPGMDRLFS